MRVSAVAVVVLVTMVAAAAAAAAAAAETARSGSGGGCSGRVLRASRVRGHRAWAQCRVLRAVISKSWFVLSFVMSLLSCGTFFRTASMERIPKNVLVHAYASALLYTPGPYWRVLVLLVVYSTLELGTRNSELGTRKASATRGCSRRCMHAKSGGSTPLRASNLVWTPR